MVRVFAYAVVALSIILYTPASAATVQSLQGGATYNSGGGYKRLTAEAQLKPGDLVLVNPGSSVQIAYNGCSVIVQTGSVYVVQPDGVCAIGVTDATPYVIGAGVVGGGIAAGVLLLQKSGPASP